MASSGNRIAIRTDGAGATGVTTTTANGTYGVGEIIDIQVKIKLELVGLRDTLQQLIDHCHGDDRPGCPIIEDLANRSTV